MDDFAIKVEDVSKVFKLPHEKSSSIKSSFVNMFRSKKGYELQEALKDVSFEIKKGEFFGIVGRNGSGKSTLLKLLAGIYSPSQGQVHVRGSLTPFIELGVGFNPELTGRENVFLNGALLGFNRKEMQKMYPDIVEFAELKKFMDQKLKNYSSGMQVRLAFSIAIRAESEILLLDEVLAVGDAAFQQKCYSYFENLKQENKTVVFVSHDMDAVRRFCTRAIYIKDGLLTHEGAPPEIADVYLEENMESSNQSSTPEKQAASKKYSLSAKLTNQTRDRLEISFSYKSESNEGMYIGLAVIKEGISFAEIGTPRDKPLKKSGKISYSLATDSFNNGIYHIGAGLFSMKNGELLAVSKNKIPFILKGGDATKGGALRLADSWEYQ